MVMGKRHPLRGQNWIIGQCFGFGDRPPTSNLLAVCDNLGGSRAVGVTIYSKGRAQRVEWCFVNACAESPP
jgi:hypothetical protein